MPVPRHWQTQELLKNPVYGGGRRQILAAHNVGHALRSVINDNGEVVARGRVLSGKDNVAPCGGVGAHVPAVLGPRDGPGPCHRRLHIQPERMGLSRFNPAFALGSG